MMKQKNNPWSGFAALMAATLFSTFAQARSLLYYYDFDTVSDGALVWQNANKGTGAVVPTLKANSSETPLYADGALDSDHAFYANNTSAIWLGSDSTPLECSTEKGFTISFWCKLSASHNASANFFGFRVGGRSYRFEYEDSSTTKFTIRGSGGKAGAVTLRNLDTGDPDNDYRLFYSDVPANEWHHFAIVATPNGTNTLGTSGFYVDGEKIGYLALVYAGALQQINIGQYVREGLDGIDRITANAKTAIDELAVFDYPATVEQLKWLAKYKPAQPANGPAREMPYCWHFDTTNKTFGATAKVNSGTGTKEAFLFDIEDESNPGTMKKADETRIVLPTTNAALGTAYAGRLGGRPTWRVVDSDGLGPTVGSGFTISFWMRADQTLNEHWKSFFYFCVGGRYLRYDFENSDGSSYDATISIKGKEDGTINLGKRTANTWQHYCAVWNNDTKEIDYYIDGTKKGNGVYKTTSKSSDAVTAMYAGRLGYSGDGNSLNGDNITLMNNVYIDEVALFNHSFSPEQVQRLASNVPCLPALDATNLVRTVSGDVSWSGGLASWGVREWDAESETWTATSRTSIYPALEDTEVDVEVTLADGVTLTNDTFVTPKSLLLKAETDATVSATLVSEDDSMFDPATFELGEGVNLSVAAGAIAMKTGTIKFNEGSSIKVDCDGIDNEWTEVLSAKNFTLPEGAGTILDYVKAQRGNYKFEVEDGTIMCKKVHGLMIIFK